MSRTRDHIIPLSAGGPDVRENWQPAHLGCNSSKGSRVGVMEAPVWFWMRLYRNAEWQKEVAKEVRSTRFEHWMTVTGQQDNERLIRDNRESWLETLKAMKASR